MAPFLFFAANIRNKNTRAAYAHAVTEFFDWCESMGFDLTDLRLVVLLLFATEPSFLRALGYYSLHHRCRPHA